MHVKQNTLVILSISLGVLFSAGCTTIQIVPVPDTPIPPNDKARVVMSRENTQVGAERLMTVYDNTTKVGLLGTNAPLIWDRDPGAMMLFIEQTGDKYWSSLAPVSATVSPGRIYEYQVSVTGAISLRLPGSPSNPATAAPQTNFSAPVAVSQPAVEYSTIITDTSPGVGIALIIGINKYDTLGELDSCQQDAAAFRETLVKNGGYNPNRVMLITDNAPTKEFAASYANLTRRIDQACKLAKPKDTLLIYFAGHGITAGNEMYLVPQDGGEPRTCISVGWLQQAMEKSASGGKMLVLDACHSGKATRGVSGIVPSKFNKQGVLTLSSCADDELSYQENKNGVFTKFMLAGLQGAADANKDNQVSASELFQFIQANMENWSMRSGKTQRPQISDETSIVILSKPTSVSGKRR